MYQSCAQAMSNSIEYAANKSILRVKVISKNSSEKLSSHWTVPLDVCWQT